MVKPPSQKPQERKPDPKQPPQQPPQPPAQRPNNVPVNNNVPKNTVNNPTTANQPRPGQPQPQPGTKIEDFSNFFGNSNPAKQQTQPTNPMTTPANPSPKQPLSGNQGVPVQGQGQMQGNPKPNFDNFFGANQGQGQTAPQPGQVNRGMPQPPSPQQRQPE